MHKNSYGQIKLSSHLLILVAIACSSVVSGCSSLSALGIPVGGSNNEIIGPAKRISETPRQAILTSKELAKSPLPTYIVELGDTILVEPIKFDATIRLPGDQVVKPDGTISLGEFGRYSAVNKTVEQIQEEVQELINGRIRQNFEIEFERERRHREEDRDLNMAPEVANNFDGSANTNEEATDLSIATENTQEERVLLDRRIQEAISQNEISVRLVNWESKRYYVLGEVNSPGFFTVRGGETVLDAIVEAGGITNSANKHQIIVARPSRCNDCRVVMKVCYDQIVQLGDASTNYQLQPGDRVFVPSLTFLEDVKKSLRFGKDANCPRCANCQRGCNLPEGCD